MAKEARRGKRARRQTISAVASGRDRAKTDWNSVDPSGRVAAAMAGVRAASGERVPWPEVLELFRVVDLAAIASRDHLLTVLDSWANAAYHSERLDEMEAVVRRARSLADSCASEELRVSLLLTESMLAHGRANRLRQDQLLEQALATAKSGSTQHREIAFNQAMSLAMFGRGLDAEPQMHILAASRTELDLARLANVRFTNAVETTRPEEAAAALRELQQFPRYCEEMKFHLTSHTTVHRLLLGRWSGAASREGEAGEEELPDWVQVMDLLFFRRSREALEAAHDYAAAHAEGLYPRHSDLLRAELSCGNAQAARRVLEWRRAAGDIRYLDDLFFARIALLDGDREAAARHFAEVVAACERYGARGRLDFELRLACELSPSDLFQLGRAAGSGEAPSTPLPARSEVAKPGAELRGLDRLIGRSRLLAAVRESIMRMASLKTPVLITGATGTGKELVARALHEAGPRAAEPFLAVNCGAITESLLESELFGHERGAFTGASAAHRGFFEEAGKGTILLDEIGDMPSRLQVALLRVLESGEIRPVGASLPRKIACRILAATNADLPVLTESGTFRSDLLYRLQRLEIRLLPLHERMEDILPLAEHFLAEDRRDGLRPAMAPEVQRWLLEQEWPGNVRELRNFIERLRLLGSEQLYYGPDDLAAVRQRAAISFGAGSAAVHEVIEPANPPGGGDSSSALQHDSHLRRPDRARELFREHGKLMRKELAAMLKVSLCTAGRCLEMLIAEGFIEKVAPTASRRTHYFRLRSGLQ